MKRCSLGLSTVLLTASSTFAQAPPEATLEAAKELWSQLASGESVVAAVPAVELALRAEEKQRNTAEGFAALEWSARMSSIFLGTPQWAGLWAESFARMAAQHEAAAKSMDADAFADLLFRHMRQVPPQVRDRALASLTQIEAATESDRVRAACLVGRGQLLLERDQTEGLTEAARKAGAEALRTALEKFSDVATPLNPRRRTPGGPEHATVGDLVPGPLFAIEHLYVGATAPELTGKALDGEPLQLSDHRGEVVLLSFWADW